MTQRWYQFLKKVVKKTYSVNKILQPSIALSSSAWRLLYPVSPPTLSTVKTNGAPCDRGLCRDGKPCGLSLLHYRSRFPVLTSELRMHVREQLADTLHHVRKPITCTTKTAAQYCSAEIKTNRHTYTLWAVTQTLFTKHLQVLHRKITTPGLTNPLTSNCKEKRGGEVS